ncbi:MAG: RNA polymerase factor sigma-54, partial [Gammaproteobacteria bacterium]
FHLPLLAKQQYEKLQQKLQASEPDFLNALHVLKQLHPKPGLDWYHTKPSDNINPDLIVYKKNSEWRVNLNSRALPKLRISSNYSDLIRKSDNSRANQLLKEQLNEARWFMKSIQHRNDMLLQVGEEIVQRQSAFFELGEAAMRPMLLQDVALSLGVHESTISRITTQKFMLTPRGTFELKYFFSGHVGSDKDSDRSSIAIRALLKKIIKTENRTYPFSDQRLVELLQEQGIKIARRTVTKYREALQIPPSHLRKTHTLRS